MYLHVDVQPFLSFPHVLGVGLVLTVTTLQPGGGLADSGARLLLGDGGDGADGGTVDFQPRLKAGSEMGGTGGKSACRWTVPAVVDFLPRLKADSECRSAGRWAPGDEVSTWDCRLVRAFRGGIRETLGSAPSLLSNSLATWVCGCLDAGVSSEEVSGG